MPVISGTFHLARQQVLLTRGEFTLHSLDIAQSREVGQLGLTRQIITRK